MDPKQLALAQKLLKALADIREEIKAVRVDKQSSKNANSQPLPIDLRSELRIPHAICEYYEAEQRERRSCWPRIKFWLEVVGVGSAFALAVFAFCTLQLVEDQTSSIRKSSDATQGQLTVMQQQLAAMQNQLTESAKNFRTDERAWISPSFLPGPRQSNQLGDAICGLSIANVGKTQAQEVTSVTVVLVVPKETGRLAFDYSPGIKHVSGIIFPNSPPKRYGVPIVEITKDKKAKPLTWAQITRPVYSGDVFVVGYGTISYWDIFGKPVHKLSFCQMLEYQLQSKTGLEVPHLLEQCSKYNRSYDEQ